MTEITLTTFHPQMDRTIVKRVLLLYVPPTEVELLIRILEDALSNDITILKIGTQSFELILQNGVPTFKTPHFENLIVPALTSNTNLSLENATNCANAIFSNDAITLSTTQTSTLVVPVPRKDRGSCAPMEIGPFDPMEKRMN